MIAMGKGNGCFNCEMFDENINSESRMSFAAAAKMPPDQVSCKGCRARGGVV
jgi:hypothetical protein